MGISIAICVRVGTALGAADMAQAKLSVISGMLCAVGIALIVGILVSILKNKLGHVFTDDEEVIALVNQALVIYIIFQLFEAICCVYGGVLRGTGRQAFGAIVNAVVYYVVGLPLGSVLTFVARMRINGLWLGMLTSSLLAAVTLVVYTAHIDWKLAAEQAQEHAGLQPPRAQRGAPGAGRGGAGAASVATSSAAGIVLTTYSRPGWPADSFRAPEAALALSAPDRPLSAKQLALRRGAALGAAVAVLVAGLAVRVLASGH